MKATLTSLLAITLLCSCDSAKQSNGIQYPETQKTDQSDTYFGTVVPDPYRWLENDTSRSTEEWVVRQNAFTNSFLEAIPFRGQLRNRLESLVNYERFTAPVRAGSYYLYYRNNGLQNQDVIYIKSALDDKEEVFLDPNEFDKSGTTTMHMSGMSKDERFVAISVSKAGSDWRELVVFDIEKRKSTGDTLKWVKFSGASWSGDGFYYSRYPEPEKGSDYSAFNAYHSVYYHALGQNQSLDKLVYKDEAHPERYHSAYVSEDGEFLFLYIAEGTDGFECHYTPLNSGDIEFRPLFTGFEHKSSVIDHSDGRFIVRTDIDAPNYKLVSLDPAMPQKEHWTTLLDEKDYLLQDVNTCGGYLFARYLKQAMNVVYRYNYEGKDETEIILPGPGSAGGFNGRKKDSEAFYSFSSFTEPGTIFRYDIAQNQSSLYFRPDLVFNPDQFESKQVFYPSKDGTRISMFIVHKKDLVLDGNNPLLLYGYGGFNISLTSGFNSSIIPWIECGGVYAVPNLRGGGEYGETWHRAGMLLNKQNVFDDFISAAEYLIDQKYTSSEKLVISGRSNGGLLVGAVMTQRPDLMKVALPGVGVMDMLRYHKFTVGHGWIPEYGSSEDSVQFKNLYAYSPLHNLKSNVAYPATLIYTGDHDDRVVPAHSFKFAATLQEKTIGANPCLIRIETDAGHGSGKPISKRLDEEADKLAFSFYHTGLKPCAEN